MKNVQNTNNLNNGPSCGPLALLEKVLKAETSPDLGHFNYDVYNLPNEIKPIATWNEV